MDWGERTFVEVYHKAHGLRELQQQVLEVQKLNSISRKNDQGVVSVLKNRARQRVINRMREDAIVGSLDNKALEDIGHNNEQVG